MSRQRTLARQKVKLGPIDILKAILTTVIVVTLLMTVRLIPGQLGGTGHEGNILSDTAFIDASGNRVEVHEPMNRIISLSSVHTENLYEIGSGDVLIGVDETSVYPYPVTGLPRYKLHREGDIRQIINAMPDCILIDRSLNDSKPSLVSRFETAGIQVIALEATSLMDFRYYIEKLGILTGRQDQAGEALELFYSQLAQMASDYSLPEEERARVFIETSEKGYWTAAKNSLLAEAAKLAGVNLLIPDSPWYELPDPYDSALGHKRILTGKDYIISNSNNIDVYMTIRGNGNTGAELASLLQRSEFRQMPSIYRGHLYELKTPLFDRFTFRYIDGIRELNRLVYGDPMNYTGTFDEDTVLTREVFARILYEKLTLQTFTIYRKDYYDHKKFHHTYGAFEDVTWDHEDFNIVETVTTLSYLLPVEVDGKEYFMGDQTVTSDELQHFFYIWKDVKEEALYKIIDQETFEAIDTAGEFIAALDDLER